MWWCLTAQKRLIPPNLHPTLLQPEVADAISTFPRGYIFTGAHSLKLKFFPLRAPSLLKDVGVRFREQWLSLIALYVEPRQMCDITFGLSCWQKSGQIKGRGPPSQPGWKNKQQERWNRPNECFCQVQSSWRLQSSPRKQYLSKKMSPIVASIHKNTFPAPEHH